jgi:hypothetical protein
MANEHKKASTRPVLSKADQSLIAEGFAREMKAILAPLKNRIAALEARVLELEAQRVIADVVRR